MSTPKFHRCYWCHMAGRCVRDVLWEGTLSEKAIWVCRGTVACMKRSGAVLITCPLNPSKKVYKRK